MMVNFPGAQAAYPLDAQANAYPNPQPTDPRDKLSQDEILMLWETSKLTLAKAKEAEMELRKYVVKRAFPQPKEGMNTQELGNGYQLKASVKFNYKLDNDNKKIEAALDRISAIGNEGPFIAERLVSWSPHFLLTEYRVLQEQANEGNVNAKAILNEISTVLVIEDAAPTLEIKEPKVKK